jgi:hypothetical protein
MSSAEADSFVAAVLGLANDCPVRSLDLFPQSRNERARIPLARSA